MATQPDWNQWNEFNRRLIEEFRANGGTVSGDFSHVPMLLLTTTGAKSGRRITTPLTYGQDGDRIFVYASKAGAPTNPDWYHNVVANPAVSVELGTETFDAQAVVVTGDERDRLYAEQVARMPQFGDYQTSTDRIIPVVALDRT